MEKGEANLLDLGDAEELLLPEVDHAGTDLELGDSGPRHHGRILTAAKVTPGGTVPSLLDTAHAASSHLHVAAILCAEDGKARVTDGPMHEGQPSKQLFLAETVNGLGLFSFELHGAFECLSQKRVLKSSRLRRGGGGGGGEEEDAVRLHS